MKAETVSEQAILQQAREGDAAAFGLLVRRYERPAYFAALGILGNPDDAMDVTQDAFVRAHGRLELFDMNRPFYPWFHRLLRNLCLNRIRSKKRRRESSLDALQEQGLTLEAKHTRSPEEETDRALLRDRLGRAMLKLTPMHREIIVLREFEDLSYNEIAEQLGIPRGTVMSRLHGARKSLRDILGPMEEMDS